MKDIWLYPYKDASKSAIVLSEALDCYRINRVNSTFTYGANKAIINWGHGNPLPTEVLKCNPILNKPEAICNAVNKLSAFKLFIENRVRCPEYTTDILTAKQWSVNGHFVFCRLEASGSDGAGLVLKNPGQEIPSARFYTKGLLGRHEYRVNVVGDEIVTYQRKVEVTDFTGTRSSFIRTTAGGWGFEVVEDERNIPPNIDDECILAVKALGLDFGGVDVIDIGGWAHVLEVNTAPHLTPYGARKMAEALKEYIG